MLSPRVHKMNMMGLGSSVGTTTEGINAEVLVVNSFKELEENAEKV